jgi:hypothetical protein
MLAILFLVMAEVWNVPAIESKTMRAVAHRPGCEVENNVSISERMYIE